MNKKSKSVSLPGGLREVLFEFRQVGRVYRVTAIDPATRTEVIMVADPTYGEEMIKNLAARKLAYVIEKKRRSGKPPTGDVWA